MYNVASRLNLFKHTSASNLAQSQTSQYLASFPGSCAGAWERGSPILCWCLSSSKLFGCVNTTDGFSNYYVPKSVWVSICLLLKSRTENFAFLNTVCSYPQCDTHHHKTRQAAALVALLPGPHTASCHLQYSEKKLGGGQTLSLSIILKAYVYVEHARMHAEHCGMSEHNLFLKMICAHWARIGLDLAQALCVTCNFPSNVANPRMRDYADSWLLHGDKACSSQVCASRVCYAYTDHTPCRECSDHILTTSVPLTQTSLPSITCNQPQAITEKTPGYYCGPRLFDSHPFFPG